MLPIRPAHLRALLCTLLAGCATVPPYEAQLLARGELALRHDGHFQMYAENRLVAESLRWDGLHDYVRCVPEASRHAQAAEADGRAATAFTWLGVSLGIASLGGFAGFAVDDGKHLGPFLGTAVGVAIAGTVFAGLSRLFKNRANGQAVDAMNFYNDAVGSLGATCADLTYPAPVGPASAPLPPPLPSAPPTDTPPSMP